ncbi:hypothetical protein B0A52_01824 [Exophiala mesophila]|uniref:Deacetylase sirtuin-type domain-containing protein n=1 Tax=Exophiala mesophila TaxID=212818 RepID=A0A438NG50_EXOME|nr:hypothetical protein B0A52_01824 [Exophiala mesophila]
MSKPLLRIPYTGPLPAPLIIPPSAATKHGAIAALAKFLTSPLPSSHTGIIDGNKSSDSNQEKPRTVLLSGAGLSTASGLADYRGPRGTYTQNRSYRPIYFHEFVDSHTSRQRYWARSFLGWRGLKRSKPNAGHEAIRDLGSLGLVTHVVTQNVDSFHPIAHPTLPTVELHGYLRTLICLSCGREMDRAEFQSRLAALNPAWAEFLAQLLKTGALDTEDPVERRSRGLKTNPDGDADVPGAPYSTFRYPACPSCVKRPPIVGSSSSSSGGGRKGGEKLHVQVDADGAWIESNLLKKGGSSTSTTTAPGILKPNVIMFGESIPARIKAEAESAIDSANRILVVGSSLATYSAWRLVKRAADRSMPIAILNMGGVRKEDAFFNHIVPAASFQEEQQQQQQQQQNQTSATTQRFAIGVEQGSGKTGDSDSGLTSSSSGLGPVRASLPAEEVLPGVVQEVKRILGSGH